jgi:hypothetical protein
MAAQVAREEEKKYILRGRQNRKSLNENSLGTLAPILCRG